MLKRLPGKVSHCDVDFVKVKQKVFALSEKSVFMEKKSWLLRSRSRIKAPSTPCIHTISIQTQSPNTTAKLPSHAQKQK